MKTLLLIDSNGLIHRFFHALPPFTTKEGGPVGAIYGLSVVLLKIFREQKPNFVAAAFDRPEPTFRKEAYQEYKIHRPPTANELISQIIEAHNTFSQFGIKFLETPGFEADDIVGTLAEKFSNESDLKIIILSGDLDVLQLVKGEKIMVDFIKKGTSETVLYDEKAVFEKYQLSPGQLPDYKGLVGDASDNIPGVAGVGPKTATDLLKEYKSLENILDNLVIINPKIAKKIEPKKEDAIFSKKLATIRRDAPINIQNLEELKLADLNKEKLANYFQGLGFKSLVEKMKN